MRSQSQYSHHYHNKNILIILLISLHIISLCSFSQTLTLTLIQETCKKCSESDPNISYEYCAATLESGGPHNIPDLRHLGLLSIRLTKRNVTNTKHFVKRISSGKRGQILDPYVKACLSDCTVLYSDAIHTIKDAVKDYKKKRYDDVNIKLSSVVDASTTCEDGFNGRDGVVSPLTERNNDVFRLSVISLSIVNMLNDVA